MEEARRTIETGYGAVEQRRRLETDPSSNLTRYVTSYTSVAGRGGHVVVCPPIGEEQGFARGPLHRVAARLAARGRHVTTYDPTGHGDSSGEFVDLTFDMLVDDLVSVAKDATAIVGVRFGAAVAVSALAERRLSPKRLVLVEPVLFGSTYARELVRGNVATQIAAFGKPRITAGALRGRLRDGVPMDVDGHALGRDLFAAIEQCEAFARLPSVAHVAMDFVTLASPGRPTAELLEISRRCPSAVRHEVEEPEFWHDHRHVSIADLPRLSECLVELLAPSGHHEQAGAQRAGSERREEEARFG